MGKHITKHFPSVYRPDSEERIITLGTPLKDGPTRVTVVDEDSFNQALEIMAEGPFLVSTEHKMYKLDDFDTGTEIVGDRLANMKVTIVEAVKPVAKPTKPLYLATPPSSSSASSIIRVVDKKTFDRALELAVAGPVTISYKNDIHKGVQGFDAAAEILVNIMQFGGIPTVDARHLALPQIDEQIKRRLAYLEAGGKD